MDISASPKLPDLPAVAESWTETENSAKVPMASLEFAPVFCLASECFTVNFLV